MATWTPPSIKEIQATALAAVPEEHARSSLAFYELLDEIVQMQIETRDRLWWHFGARWFLSKKDRRNARDLGNKISIDLPGALLGLISASGRLETAGYTYEFIKLIDGSNSQFVRAWIDGDGKLLPHGDKAKHCLINLD